MSTNTIIKIRFITLGEAQYFHALLRYYAGLVERQPQWSHPRFGLTPERAGQIEEYVNALADVFESGASLR